MYEYYFFDLDGTITETGLGITNSVMYALDKFNIKVNDRNELLRFVGPPLRDSFRDFYGFSEEQAEEATTLFRVYYREKGYLECEIYEGVRELLEELKARGKKIFLATSKPEEFAVKILENFDLLKYFDFVSGATMGTGRTSKYDVIQYALDQIPFAEKESILMIGDRMYDIEGAKAHGLDSAGVTYGYGSREELTEADATYLADKALELLKL